jgi:hypothetical protein
MIDLLHPLTATGDLVAAAADSKGKKVYSIVTK